MSNVVELSNLEKEIIDNAIEVTKDIKKDEKPNWNRKHSRTQKNGRRAKSNKYIDKKYI